MDQASPPAPWIDDPLPYVAKLDARPLAQIDLVVIHATALPDLADARTEGERVRYPSGTGNSGHYYIDRDGSIRRYVPDDRVAHHVVGFNSRSIGIEMINRLRWPDWYSASAQQPTEPFSDAQIGALSALLTDLQARLPALRFIAGHADLDHTLVPSSDSPDILVRRKIDPGPMFPWSQVEAAFPMLSRSLNDRDSAIPRPFDENPMAPIPQRGWPVPSTSCP